MTTQTNAAQTPAAQAKVKAEPSTKNTASSEVDQLVRKGLVALRELNRFDQKQIDPNLKKASVAALNQHRPLTMAAIDKTGRGVFEDKAVKNIFACEHVTHSMAEMRTVGVIRRDEIKASSKSLSPWASSPGSLRSPTPRRPRSSRP